MAAAAVVVIAAMMSTIMMMVMTGVVPVVCTRVGAVVWMVIGVVIIGRIITDTSHGQK